ncbi:MAG: hypothetical protein K6D55_04630 [Prevotella sp.]|nr:hypothetical protein [Prevotella sp.]
MRFFHAALPHEKKRFAGQMKNVPLCPGIAAWRFCADDELQECQRKFSFFFGISLFY